MLKTFILLTFFSLLGCSNQTAKTVEVEPLTPPPAKEVFTANKPVIAIKPSADTTTLPFIEHKKTYHGNGKLAYITTYKDNIKTNKEYFTYYKSGELSIKSTSIEGQKHGLVSYYSKNGNIWRTQQYQKGKREGFSISYYSPDVMAKKSHFKAGLLEGPQEAFLPNGKRSDKWVYQQDILQLHFKFQYFESGEVQFQSAYSNNEKNGLSNEYSQNGELLSSINYKSGLRHGKTLKFYNNGKIKTEANYKKNQQHGGSSGYYLTGNLQWQSYYKQGLREGSYKEYYQHGQLKKQINYHNDKQNGPKRFFHENGLLKYELTMKDSKADGLLKEFDDKGELKAMRHYHNGIITKENSSFLNGYFLWLSENEMEKLIH